jgi:hypothetical protein
MIPVPFASEVTTGGLRLIGKEGIQQHAVHIFVNVGN